VSWLAVLLLIAGLVLVVAGAELFFEAVLASASRLHVSAFAFTAVVSGFELENLAAGIALDLNGLPDAAAGTFLGGTTFLALAVAGLGALVAPLRPGLPRPALAWTAAAGVPLLVLGADGRLGRIDGAILVAWFAVALFGLARSAPPGPPADAPPGRVVPILLRLVAGLGLLSVGGELLGESLRRVVERFGVSATLLGNTAIAASVEAEEVARVAVPARRGRSDVALGNIVGTVVHFAALNGGIIALVRPLELGDDSRALHLPVAAASAAVLAGLLAAGDGLGRRAGGLLVALYVAYLVAAVAASLY